MAESNLGSYKVIVEADYAGLIASTEAIAKTIQQSADLMTAKMSAMTDALNKNMSEMAATMKSTASLSSEQLNNINQSLGKIDASGASKSIQHLSSYTEQLGPSFKKASESANAFTGMLGKMRSHIEWLATAGLVGAAIFIPFEAVKSIADVEQQMAGMIQTLPQLHNNQSALNTVTHDFIGIAEQYGMEVDKIIEAGKLWSRGYKDVGEVMALTGLSAKLAVADMMDVSLANRAVESVINSYGKQADAVSFATHVVDSWTNVAHNSQSSATDLAEALMRSAAAAHVVGVSFDTTTALAATMIKTTGQQGGMIGNALKSIFSSIHSDKAIEDLQKLGIQIYNFDKDGTAHFRDVASIITDLMLTTHETSQNMQKDLEHVAGGKFQWGRAAALFGDYADFIKTYNLAINSFGFSEGQIAAQMDTISRKIQQVKASMDGLLVNAGNSGLSQTIKTMLDNINSFIKGLQLIPASAYQVMGVTAAMGVGWLVVTKTLSFLNAGIIGLRTALAATIPAKAADVIASEAEAAALAVDTIATNANTAAKSRLAIATTVASSGLNLIIAALSAATIGGIAYATALGSTASTTENTIQKNEDLIAAKKQELEMNQKQVEFIGTLGQSYIRLKEDQDAYKDNAAKLAEINKDLGATEDELTKIVGKDGLERIKTSDDLNAAIEHEQEVHSQKATDIKTSLDKLVTAQKDLRDNTIQYCNDRIDAINNEAVDFDKAADAIGRALGRIQEMMFRYYRSKASYFTDMANGLDKEGSAIPGDSYIGNFEQVGEGVSNQYREIADSANASAEAIKQAGIAVAVNQSKSALGLGGHWYPSGESSTVGGDETTPVEPKGKKGRQGTGETEYQIRKKEFEVANAKAQYEADIAGEAYTLDKKLALWREYMDDVTKIDDKHHQEMLDWQKETYKLSHDDNEQQIALMVARFDWEAALNRARRDNVIAIQNEIERKIKENIALTADEEKIYAKMRTSANEPAGSEKKLKADTETYNLIYDHIKKEAENLKKQADVIKEAANELRSTQYSEAQNQYKNHLITQPQLLKIESQQNQESYDATNKSVEDALQYAAIDPQKMLADYREYIETKDALRKKDLLAAMVANTQEGKSIVQDVMIGQQAYTAFYKKKREIEEADYDYQMRYQLAGINAFQNAVTQSLNGIMQKTMSAADAIRNVFSSMIKAIENQFANDLAQKWTQSLAQMVLGHQRANQQMIAATQANAATEIVIKQTADATIITLNNQKNAIKKSSDAAASKSAVADIGQEMLQMLEMMAIIYAISALFGGGGSSKTESTSSVSLGRSPTSYYSTPTAVPQITVPSFDIGAEMLPENMFAYVHKGEMILTPELADNIRSLGSNGGVINNRQQQRPIVMNNNFSPSLIDSRGINQVYKETNREFMNNARRAIRRFDANPHGKFI